MAATSMQMTPEERLAVEEQLLREMAARYGALIEQDRRRRMEEQKMNLNPQELIKVEQLPVLTEQILSIKKQWEAVSAECEAMACTAATIQAVKGKRAEINKAFEVLEARRKTVKLLVMTPYNELEAVYKECVTVPHQQAEDALKQKIEAVENEIKSACEQRMRTYFAEQCQAEHIDWLTWEMGGFKVGLTEAKKKVPATLMGEIADFVVRVAQDVKSIEGMEFAAEIMDEYKRSRLLGPAIDVVQSRHRWIEEEKQATAARAEALKREQEAVAKVEAAALPPSVPPVVGPPVMDTPVPTKNPDEVFPEFTFTVYGATRRQLIALREYMKKEGIQYER